MAAITLKVILVAAMNMLAIANPRCLVRRIQTQPIVWMCDGATHPASHGNANEAKILVPANGNLFFVDVPVGTRNFSIILLHQQKGQAEIQLTDKETGENIVKDQMVVTGNTESHASHLKTYSYSSEGNQIKYLEKDYYGQATLRLDINHLVEKPTTRVFSIFLKNNHDEDVFTLHYKYDPYTSGPQCVRESASIGCSEFNGPMARDTATSWISWVKTQYDYEDSAWEALAEFDKDQNNLEDVPYYRWPTMWMKYPQAKDQDKWNVFKFITHGGLEVGAKFLERGFFQRAYDKLVPLSHFAHDCCQTLKSSFPDADAAWASAVPKDGSGMIELCGGDTYFNEHGLDATDYLKWYLDPDGIGGTEAKNWQYCWENYMTPPPTPPPTPAPDMSKPAPILSPSPSPSPFSPSPGSEPSPSPASAVTYAPLSSDTATDCSWTLHGDCAGSFTLKGQRYTGCTKKDWHKGWCSTTSEYSGEFRECSWDCRANTRCYWKPADDCVKSFDYKGRTYEWCTIVDHQTGWCSKKSTFQPLQWRHCDWVGSGCGAARPDVDESEYTDATEIDEFSGTDTPGVTSTATNCAWSNMNCPATWEYNGKSYSGCTNIESAQRNSYWCSLDATYKGKWAPCGWECEHQDICYWKPRPMCLPSFTYNGQPYNWCTKANNMQNGAWCSETPVGGSNWHHCEWECPCKWEPASNCKFPFTYKGEVYNGCTKVDKSVGWCSTTEEYSGGWSACVWKCPDGVSTSAVVNILPQTTLSTTTLKPHLKCSWVKNAECVGSFAYEGRMISGCTTETYGAEHPWCSNESSYRKGAVKACIQECGWEPNNCRWTPDKRCVANFEYKGYNVQTCTKENHHTKWCSTTPQYSGDWRHCTWDCPCFWKPDPACVPTFTYKGKTVEYCTTEDGPNFGKGWCSLTPNFETQTDQWKTCTKECPQDESQYNDKEIISLSADTCVWDKDPQCVFPFNYEGVTYDDCTEVNHNGGWCSTDQNYNGGWKHCTWGCDAPKGCTFNEPKQGCVQNFTYKGQRYNGCTNVDHNYYWCSEDEQYSGKWLQCEPRCPCYWEPVPTCAKSFSYKGKMYTGCITIDREEGWCSTDTQYAGNYAVCNLECQEDEYNKANPGKTAAIIVGSSAAAAVGLGAIGYGITIASMNAQGGGPEACPNADIYTINQPERFRSYSSASLMESTLFSTTAWVAGGEGQHNWMTIDLTKPVSVAGIVMRARHDAPEWVTQYEVFSSSTTTDEGAFSPIGSTYSGPPGFNSESKVIFGVPVMARFIRIFPLQWKGGDYPAMRVAVLGCEQRSGVSTMVSTFSSRINDITINWDGSQSGTPEMYNGSAWNPICGQYFWNNNNGAQILCKSNNFWTGQVWRVGDGTYPQDSVFVQQCQDGNLATLQDCSAGGWATSGTLGLPECERGRQVGIQVKCEGGIMAKGAPGAEHESSSDSSGSGHSWHNLDSSGGSSVDLSGNSSWGGPVFVWVIGIISVCCCLNLWIPFVLCWPKKKARGAGLYYDSDDESVAGDFVYPGGQQMVHPSNFFPPQTYDDRMSLMQQQGRYY